MLGSPYSRQSVLNLNPPLTSSGARSTLPLLPSCSLSLSGELGCALPNLGYSEPRIRGVALDLI